MDSLNKELLIKISQLYYIENLNQSEISRKLGIHRSTISRLLKSAREEGIVKIEISTELSTLELLSNKIEDKYNIDKVIIISRTNGMDINQTNTLIVKNSLYYLRSIIKSNMKIGFSWGGAMSALAINLTGFDTKDINCIPLIGGPSGRVISDYHVNTIIYEASKKLNGRALMIDSPAFPENSTVKSSLLNDKFNSRIINYWNHLDIAFFGIGSPLLKKSERWQEFYGKDIFNDIIEDDVAGDIVSRFFDESGNHIPNQLGEIIIGITPEQLKK